MCVRMLGDNRICLYASTLTLPNQRVHGKDEYSRFKQGVIFVNIDCRWLLSCEPGNGYSE